MIFFRFKSIVGIGVGAGAYILAKFAVSHIQILLLSYRFISVLKSLNYCFYDYSVQLIFPDLVEGLVLLNIDPNGKGWIDWAATKVSAYKCFKSVTVTVGVEGYTHIHTYRLDFCCLSIIISLSVPQLSGLTSALPDTVLPHLFSQVSSESRNVSGHTTLSCLAMAIRCLNSAILSRH